jgi:hypothetical protein
MCRFFFHRMLGLSFCLIEVFLAIVKTLLGAWVSQAFRGL